MYCLEFAIDRIGRVAAHYRVMGLFAVLLSSLLPAGPSSAEQMFTPSQLQDDLAALEHVLYDEHPDIGHSADRKTLSRQIIKVRRALNHAMTRDEAWRAFATLNPIMADGHMAVTFGDWRGASAEHLKQGSGFFPFEVSVTKHGQVRIAAELGGGQTKLAGASIRSINGVSMGRVSASLLGRVHGDTPDFRAGLLSDRFWFFYWKMYGESDVFDMVLEQGENRRRIRVSASMKTPVVLARATAFDRSFTFRPLPCGAAVLTLKTFNWPDRKQYFDFTQRVFQEIKQTGVTALVIDIRDNGGGDDEMWMKGVLRFIATRPYRWASSYQKRVIEGHPEPGHRTGDVVSGQLDSLIQPDQDNPLHFDGRMYLLIGRHTYSSSVLFANVVQDFGFGTVVGSGSMVRADTSGGVQDKVLPNTGLVLGWPRFILFRPHPNSTPVMLTPSVIVADDPLHPDGAVNQLLKASGAGETACPLGGDRLAP